MKNENTVVFILITIREKDSITSIVKQFDTHEQNIYILLLRGNW